MLTEILERRAAITGVGLHGRPERRSQRRISLDADLQRRSLMRALRIRHRRPELLARRLGDPRR